MSDAVDPAARRRLLRREADRNTRQEAIDAVARATSGNAIQWLESRLADALTPREDDRDASRRDREDRGSDSVGARKGSQDFDRIRPWPEQLDQLVPELEAIDREDVAGT